MGSDLTHTLAGEPMTMGAVGERFAENATSGGYRKASAQKQPLFAVDLKGSTPRAIV